MSWTNRILDGPAGEITMPVIEMRAPSPFRQPVPFQAIPQRVQQQPREWLWHGYLARGSVTILTSLWKAGKTTLIGHLLRAMCRGEKEFVGLPLTPAPVLVVTEEDVGLWFERLQDVPAGSSLYFDSRPFWKRPSPQEWQNYAWRLASWAEQAGVRLVLIDPIANLIPGEENASTAMLDFLLPLIAFKDRRITVLLLHHPRKSDGTEGRAARGSGALPGFVDILLEMRRYESDPQTRIRYIVGYSRYQETPAEVVIELAEDGRSYARLHSRLQAHLTDISQTVVSILAAANEAMTVSEMLHNWPYGMTPPNHRSLHNVLKAGLNELWKREGLGTRSNPYRYRATTAIKDEEPMSVAQPVRGLPGGD